MGVREVRHFLWICCCLQKLLTNFGCCLQILVAAYKFCCCLQILLLLTNFFAAYKISYAHICCLQILLLLTNFFSCLQILLLLTNFAAAYKFSMHSFAAYKFRGIWYAIEVERYFLESTNVSWPNLGFDWTTLAVKSAGNAVLNKTPFGSGAMEIEKANNYYFIASLSHSVI